MILSGLGPVALIVGGLALAAILYGLQRLRVQRQVVRVATTLFWQAAAQAAPPRVLHERFRHWLAYLLILAIAWLLWFAAARPALPPAPGTRAEIFYLDATAAMTAGDRFAEARRALIADASAVPAERRTVYLGDAFGTRLLAPGEDIALLPRRLAAIRPTAIPARFGDWARARQAQGPAILHYYGSAATLASAQDAHALQGYVAPPIRGNRGIVAIGAVPAASGAWDKADLLVRVSADGKAAAAPPVFTRDGRAIAATLDQTAPGRFLLRDLPADGSLIEARLAGDDGFPADDRAMFRLPDRRTIRVAMLPGVPSPIRSAVAADPALRPVAAAQADVVIRAATDPTISAKPTFVLQPAAAQPAAFRFTDTAGTPQPDLANTLDQLGLGQFDAVALADALHRPVSVEMAEGPVRTVSVWQDLFDPAGSFARSQSLPLFVSQSLRWLARPRPWIPHASAGERLVTLDGNDALADTPALAAQRLGGRIALDQPGETRIGGLPVAVTLTDSATSLGMAATLPADAPRDARTLVPLDLPFTLALIAAGLLLAGEWVLFQRGRLP